MAEQIKTHVMNQNTLKQKNNKPKGAKKSIHIKYMLLLKV